MGGAVTTTGSLNTHLAKFTGSQNIADSMITDYGTTVTVTGTFNATTLQQGGTNVLLQAPLLR